MVQDFVHQQYQLAPENGWLASMNISPLQNGPICRGKKSFVFFFGGGSWVSQVRSVAKSAGDPRFDAQMSYENFKVCNEVDFFAQELVWIKRTKRDLYRDIIDIYIYIGMLLCRLTGNPRNRNLMLN